MYTKTYGQLIVVSEAVYVGSCLGTTTDVIDDNNVKCSFSVKSSEATEVETSGVALYRACPVHTQGRYVYLLNEPKLDLCEVKIHGREG